MLSKKYFAFMMTAALVLMSSLVIFAQTAPTRGKVELKKADGTTEPVAGAKVEVYKMGSKGKLPSAKTNKKGEFAFAGLPIGEKYVFVISGEKISPAMQPGIQAGSEGVTISVSEGDGKTLTEAEVREALAGGKTPSTGNTTAANTTAPATTETPAPQATPAPQNTAEAKKAEEDAKKAQAEYEKKKAEVEAGNKKVTEGNATVKRALDEGNKAFDAKNYDLAITKYDEGIAAMPDFVGATPVLLNNKATALVNRATANYNTAVKSGAEAKTAAMPGIKKDYEDAAVAANRSLEILKAAPANDPNKLSALIQRKEAYRLMSKTGADRTKGKEATVAFQEYLAVETDAKKKADGQLGYAEALQDANEFDLAAAEFEKVLAQDPNNIDALAGAGLSLVTVGYTSGDKAKFQQAANYLQKFDDLAPATHRLKADGSIKSTIDTLKNEQKITPQKVTKKKT